MGFRFQWRPTFGPFRLNFSKRGLSSVSVGKRGAWLTFAPRGERAATETVMPLQPPGKFPTGRLRKNSWLHVCVTWAKELPNRIGISAANQPGFFCAFIVFVQLRVRFLLASSSMNAH
jgi:hypothetical protein